MLTSFSSLLTLMDRLVSFFYLLAKLALAGITLCLTYDVLARFVFRASADWALDLVQLFQVALAFIAAAPVLKMNGHINMEVLSEIVSVRRQHGISIVMCAISMFGSIWVSILAWELFRQSYQISESAFGIALPLYPWKGLVTLCFAVLAIQFFLLMVENFRKFKQSGI